MRAVLLGWLSITVATAQAPAGRIEGVVLDAASHQPVKKATVSIASIGALRGETKDSSPEPAITDVSGTFAFGNLPVGQYQLVVEHQSYPQTRMGGARKTVQVTAGETAPSVTIELIPGASVAGRIIDEDGDPLDGCIVQPHPAKNFNQGVPMMRLPTTHQDGSYRITGIPAGKYTITAQCSQSVFQPRPLSEGPDPPPATAYPLLFYPAASDLKSAQILELAAGAEKSGVDFQMRPVAVTQIHGTFAPGSADWRGRNDLRVQLAPLDPQGPRSFAFSGGQINPKDGSFEIRQVFPGSYRLIAFSPDFSAARSLPPDAGDRVGAVMRVDVADKPIEVSLQLHRAMDVSGRVEIERGNDTKYPVTAGQLHVHLTSENQFGGGPVPTQVNDDGSFTIKSVLPGEWRLRLMAPSAFVKSAWLGNDDVTHRPPDLTSGSAAPLRIVVSTNTATIKGTAPAGQTVFAGFVGDSEELFGWRGEGVDSNGQFTMSRLPPGTYRVAVADPGASPPDEGGQQVTVGEGESVTIDVKPETKPE